MTEEQIANYFGKKAYEISYAVFMISGRVAAESLKERLEHQSTALLENISSDAYEKGNKTLGTLSYLLKFGADVNLINPENSRLVVEEIDALSQQITEFINSAKLSEVNLSRVFTKLPDAATTKVNNNLAAIPKDKKQLDFSVEKRQTEIKAKADSAHSLVKSAMRQSTILEKIRQNNNCRLKDIMESIPEASERTIRYDLQDLISKGLAERIGSGGPATYYRIRAGLSSSTPSFQGIPE